MMTLQIKIKDIDTTILSELLYRNKLTIWTTREGNTFVELTKTEEGKYQIPTALATGKKDVSIKVTEYGGRGEEIGKSCVVCDEYGRELPAYYVPADGFINGNHAWFAEKEVMTVCSTYPSLDIEIVKHTISVKDNIVLLNHGIWYTGSLDGMRKKIPEFGRAAEAAIEIVKTKWCRDAHYIYEVAVPA